LPKPEPAGSKRCSAVPRDAARIQSSAIASPSFAETFELAARRRRPRARTLSAARPRARAPTDGRPMPSASASRSLSPAGPAPLACRPGRGAATFFATLFPPAPSCHRSFWRLRLLRAVSSVVTATPRPSVRQLPRLLPFDRTRRCDFAPAPTSCWPLPRRFRLRRRPRRCAPPSPLRASCRPPCWGRLLRRLHS